MTSKWSRLRKALPCFRHTHKDFLTHGYSVKHTDRERDGSRSKIQTQRDRETSTHTGRDTHSSHLHTPRVGRTERFLQKERQTGM